MEGTLLATVQHWPMATEVAGMLFTDAIARTLGMQLSILTGKVIRAERALLAARVARGFVDACVPDVVDGYRQELLGR